MVGTTVVGLTVVVFVDEGVVVLVVVVVFVIGWTDVLFSTAGSV
jgi:hypothetical protein